MVTRRRFVQGACAALIGYGSGRPRKGRAAGGPLNGLAGELTKIERESGGRLGVAVLDTATGARWGNRADERFPMCSTFKLLAAAAILARVDAGRERLDGASASMQATSSCIPRSPRTGSANPACRSRNFARPR